MGVRQRKRAQGYSEIGTTLATYKRLMEADVRKRYERKPDIKLAKLEPDPPAVEAGGPPPDWRISMIPPPRRYPPIIIFLIEVVLLVFSFSVFVGVYVLLTSLGWKSAYAQLHEPQPVYGTMWWRHVLLMAGLGYITSRLTAVAVVTWRHRRAQDRAWRKQ